MVFRRVRLEEIAKGNPAVDWLVFHLRGKRNTASSFILQKPDYEIYTGLMSHLARTWILPLPNR